MRAPGSILDQGLTNNNNCDEDDTIYEITMYILRKVYHN